MFNFLQKRRLRRKLIIFSNLKGRIHPTGLSLLYHNVLCFFSLLEKEKDKTNKKHSKMLDDLNDIALVNISIERLTEI